MRLDEGGKQMKTSRKGTDMNLFNGTGRDLKKPLRMKTGPLKHPLQSLVSSQFISSAILRVTLMILTDSKISGQITLPKRII